MKDRIHFAFLRLRIAITRAQVKRIEQRTAVIGNRLAQYGNEHLYEM